MVRFVRFDGAPGFDVGKPAGTTPFTGPIKRRVVDDGYGNTRTETIAGWEPGDVVSFDGALAEQYGHACDGTACDAATCQGDCFAEMFAADMNLRFDKSQSRKPAFVVLKTDPATRAPATDSPPKGKGKSKTDTSAQSTIVAPPDTDAVTTGAKDA